MHEKLKEAKAIGLDLDGTLYPSTPEIDNRIRTEIAKKILVKKPHLQRVNAAREYFEQRYQELQSGTRVLRELGYERPDRVMDKCLAEADVLDLIEPNPELVRILREIKLRYTTYLITSSPTKLSRQKLGKIGLSLRIFDHKVFSDTPDSGYKFDGTPFRRVIDMNGNKAGEHVYFGNHRRADILPAKALGMKTVAVWSEIPEADILISNINKIGDLLL